MSELQRLADRVAELEDALGLTAEFPRGIFPEGTFRLRVCEPLLGLLMARPFVPHQAAFDCMFGALPESDQPDPKHVSVAVCYLRKGLTAHGVTIRNDHGRGYYIDEPNKTRLREILAKNSGATG